MDPQNVFIVKEPTEMHAQMVVNHVPYDFTINARHDGRKWMLDVKLSSPSSPQSKTHSLTLHALQSSTAVIGFGLQSIFHRPNENLIDCTNDLDPQVQQTIQNLGESILLTITRSDKNLTVSLDKGLLVQ